MPTYPYGREQLEQGEELLAKAPQGELLFSGGTYQVAVTDPAYKEEFWPFLQIDDAGQIVDAFCSCPSHEEKGSCPHIAYAFLKIFNGNEEPLHLRFLESLWNQIAFATFRRMGADPDHLEKKKDGTRVCVNQTGKKLFFLKPSSENGKKIISKLVDHWQEETEETSLKFSKLPPEELSLWKEGRASVALNYELSFYSDLAKWWMQMQEEGVTPTIAFEYGDKELPKWVEAQFPDVVVGCYIAEVNLPDFIPALRSVVSPLVLHDFHSRAIDKIVYQPLAKAFILHFSKKEMQQEEPHQEAIEVGEWLYIPRKGFYPKEIGHLFKDQKIPLEKIPTVLEKHTNLLQTHLVGTKLHPDGFDVNYHLFFDPHHSLHIQGYLFEKGDLQKHTSVYFGPWAYVEGKGFYLLKNLLFDEVDTVIPKEKVSDFVIAHRHWLSAYAGFETHVASFDAPLSYRVEGNGTLFFDTHIDLLETNGEHIDFGDWIYIEKRGFYPKKAKRADLTLQAGLEVEEKNVAPFIEKNIEELEQIPGFFTEINPLEKSGLHVKLSEEGRIEVIPEHTFSGHFKARLYGTYFYVEGKGFNKIKAKFRLPEEYRERKTIAKTHEPYFVSYVLEMLSPYLLTVDSRLQKPKMGGIELGSVRMELGSWVITPSFTSEIGAVSLYDIWEALNEKKSHLFSAAGLLALNKEHFAWLKKIPKKRWGKAGKELTLTTLEWVRLFSFGNVTKHQVDEEGQSLIDAFFSFQVEEDIDISFLKSTLRPYQELGARWLWFLYQYGLSGLLCDEMGLGKTHQAMALMAGIVKAKPEAKFLVICPTSVLFHWENLLQRFLPHIKAALFYGLGRKYNDKADLILTSYGTFRSDRALFEKKQFDLAIYDELQVAKNAHSQTHKALTVVDAGMTLGLSGTPIENRLSELKSLFDIILPTYMPALSHFREEFITPIEKNGDVEKKEQLAQMVRPFILRRKKTEVLKELPEKIEEITFCPLSEEQERQYREIYNQRAKALIHEIRKEEKPLPFMHIFSLLSSLKQICDHPALYLNKWAAYKRHHSGKWERFLELLNESLESGQKVVVFSQYLDMLNIIEAYLREKGVGFAGIRGSTRNRKEQLERFKDDPACMVFVASLQAAGVGVDLVSASVVIHYDRWWNPAKENQATDRVHRIGQQRGVQVYKLVSKGTIEEHINRIIERKISLAEGIIDYDDENSLKTLTREELVQLLELKF